MPLRAFSLTWTFAENYSIGSSSMPLKGISQQQHATHSSVPESCHPCAVHADSASRSQLRSPFLAGTGEQGSREYSHRTPPQLAHTRRKRRKEAIPQCRRGDNRNTVDL